MHEKFKQIQAVRQFARLAGLVEAHHESILKDPIPHLDRAGAEIARLRRIIRDTKEALHGPISYCYEPVTMKPQSIESRYIQRHRNALAAIARVDERTTGDA